MQQIARIVIGALVGAAVGYGMYRFVGCRTGACPINGNPYLSTGLYALLGAMVAAGK